jgi:hypothetical protein
VKGLREVCAKLLKRLGGLLIAGPIPRNQPPGLNLKEPIARQSKHCQLVIGAELVKRVVLDLLRAMVRRDQVVYGLGVPAESL